MNPRGSSRRSRRRPQAQPTRPGGRGGAPGPARIRGWILPLALVAVVGAGIWYFVFREDRQARGARLLTEARQAMNLFEYAKAEKLLREAITVLPNDGLLYHNLAIVQLEQGRNEEARNSFELSASLYSPDQRGLKAEEYFQLASLDYKEEKYRDAVHHLRQAIDADPTRTLLHTRLIDLQLSMLKAPASADSSTMRFLALCGRTPRTFLDAGQVHYRRGSYQVAESLAKAALAVSDTILEAHVLLANARWKLRHFDEGLAGLEDPLRRRPRAVDLWVARASLLIGAKRFDEAHAALERALELSPRSYEANFAKLMAFSEAKRIAEAAAQAKVCLPLAPNENEERFVRGMIMNLESQIGGAARPQSGSQPPASPGADP
jgi:superkiller protein 3